MSRNIKCNICGKEVSALGISSHLRHTHKLNSKEYYDKYLKQESEGHCKVCGKETKFLNIIDGYKICCCAKHTNLYKYGVENTFELESSKEKAKETKFKKYGDANYNNRDKAKNTYLEIYGGIGLGSKEIFSKVTKTNLAKYNVTNVSQSQEVKDKIKSNNIEKYKCNYFVETDEFKNKSRETKLSKYNNANYNNIDLAKSTKQEKVTEIEKEYDCTQVNKLLSRFGQGWYYSGVVDSIKIGNCSYVRNKDIKLIEKYFNDSRAGISYKEKEIVSYLKSSFNFNIIENIRTIIYPFELDIFIPELNLAVEYNGTYWHSKVAKDYHLKKSILCRNKGIRLVHIYEFEDFNEQLYLLSELIKGNDLYNKDDFNKNNLLIEIPSPELIYNNIYGAGKLY